MGGLLGDDAGDGKVILPPRSIWNVNYRVSRGMSVLLSEM